MAISFSHVSLSNADGYDYLNNMDSQAHPVLLYIDLTALDHSSADSCTNLRTGPTVVSTERR